MAMTYHMEVVPGLGPDPVEVDELGRVRPRSWSDLDLKNQVKPQTTGQYPKLLHRHDGTTHLMVRVETAKDEAAKVAQGWSTTVEQGEGGEVVGPAGTAAAHSANSEPEKPKRGRRKKSE